MPTLDFYYDIASPYSYLAATQIEAIASDCGVPVTFKPFLLGAVFKATNNAPPAEVVARGRYLFKDIKRWAAYYGVPFHLNKAWPPNSLLPMRVLAGAPADQLKPLTQMLFHAFWAQGIDVSDADELIKLVGADAVARAKEQPAKDQLRTWTDEAIARGAFGAPSIFVDDELFFGNDRLPFVEQMLRARS